jgi:hypothetical protein
MSKNQSQELDELIERAADWPKEAREELVRSMQDIEARYHGVYITTKDDRVALKRSAEDVRQNRYASHDDVKKVFHHFHRA